MYSYIIIPGASYEGKVWFAVLGRKGFKGLTEDSTSLRAPQLAEPVESQGLKSREQLASSLA